ncbi:DNA-binding transcriptional regulator, MarR family [Goodfellowiella coeruleoviolacea]|uniref:DNA-binding transcriptional regulator, MarR family n=1 Tax=Goodfellowiella coeruleoviolacea TaxID=334858 RepID=A0AAE3GBA7_9PSEU|nr:DNA-binding transcriptional regulator, MarR family [Goodfellowiella coeruleoviolacea]
MQQLCGLVSELAWRLDEHVRGSVVGMDLTAPQAVALRELDQPLTMRELAARMCCEPPNVTYVIDRLERQGLVERRPHPRDRRAKQLVLTSAGSATRDRLLKRLVHRSPLDHLTDAERANLHGLLLRAVDRPAGRLQNSGSTEV